MAATKKRRPGRPTMDLEQAKRVRDVVRDLIRTHGGSLTETAHVLGLTPSGLHQIRSGRNIPSLQTAIAVAKATGTTLDALLGLNGDS